MGRLTIKTRIKRLSRQEDNHWNNLNPNPRMNPLFSALIKEHPTVTSLYGLGTIEIEAEIVKTNESLLDSEKIPLVELKDLVFKIIEFFGTTQVWYNAFLIKDKKILEKYLYLNTKEFKKLSNLYYTPAVLTLSILKTKLTKEEAEDIDSQAHASIGIDDVLLRNQIENIISTMNDEKSYNYFLNQVKKTGVTILAKNKSYSLPISSLLDINVSSIFKSLKYGNKFTAYLKTSSISLNLIILYQNLLTNPLLFFDMLANTADKKLLVQLNTWISLFWECFYREVPSINFTKNEIAFIKKNNAFVNIENASSTKDLRTDVYNKLIGKSRSYHDKDLKMEKEILRKDLLELSDQIDTGVIPRNTSFNNMYNLFSNKQPVSFNKTQYTSNEMNLFFSSFKKNLSSIELPIIIAENPASSNYSMIQIKTKIAHKLQFVTPEYFAIIGEKAQSHWVFSNYFTVFCQEVITLILNEFSIIKPNVFTSNTPVEINIFATSSLTWFLSPVSPQISDKLKAEHKNYNLGFKFIFKNNKISLDGVSNFIEMNDYDGILLLIKEGLEAKLEGKTHVPTPSIMGVEQVVRESETKEKFIGFFDSVTVVINSSQIEIAPSSANSNPSVMNAMNQIITGITKNSLFSYNNVIACYGFNNKLIIIPGTRFKLPNKRSFSSLNP